MPARIACVTLLLLAAISYLSAPRRLWAASSTAISVTTTDDELNRDGDCSLREAIQATNQRVAVDACLPGTGNDLIDLRSATYTLSWAGSGDNAGLTGDLDITGNLTIRGPDARTTVLDGQQRDRVLDVQPGGQLTLAGLTVLNGRSSNQSGGGIANAGTLTVVNSIVSENTTENLDITTAPFPGGGGIYSTGTLTLIDTNVHTNATFSSVFSLDPADDAGAGIHSTGTLLVIRSTINRNQCAIGSGINSTGTVHLSHSTVSYNQAFGYYGDAGGIYNKKSGSVTLIHSRGTDNGAGGRNGSNGGGITNFGRLLAINTMISANTASGGVDGGGAGGGIWNGEGATVTLEGSTVSGNVATGGRDGSGYGGGIDNWGC